MEARIFVVAGLVLLLLRFTAEAQNAPKQSQQMLPTSVQQRKEIRQFYDAYAEDLRRHHKEAIANRYDPRGYFGLGNGSKRFVTFARTIRKTT